MKKLTFLICLMFLAFGATNAWGAEVTVTKTTNTLVSELSWWRRTGQLFDTKKHGFWVGYHRGIFGVSTG